MGGGLVGGRLSLLEGLLGGEVGRGGRLGLHSDALQFGLGGGHQRGDPADLGGGGDLRGLRGADLRVARVRGRWRDCHGRSCAAERDCTAQRADEHGP